MSLNLNHLIKDISKIDTTDICSDWQWLLDNQNQVVLVSAIGDMFLIGNDKSVYWLDTGMAELNYVAENLEQFQNLLTDNETTDNWFLSDLVNRLISEGKILEENEVYSFKTLPILGGDFSTENFDTTDMSVHFSISGQIHKQLWDAQDGTKVNNVIVK
jgi:hypothetical protein